MPKECYCGNKELNEYSEYYYVCNKCHTLISKVDFNSDLYDVKDEENDLYGKNYWENIMTDMASETSLDGVIDVYLKGRIAYWLPYILKYIPLESKIAEIGCGLGQLAYVMKTMGYSQMAYELSPDICEYIKETLGVNIHCGEFQTSEETYDAVLAFDLFEHLAQPREFLQAIFERTSPNGILCLQTPVYDSDLSYEEMLEKKPRFAVQLKKREHVFLYSKSAIVALLKEVGFQDVLFEPACFGDDYDMFLFAAKQKLEIATDEEVEKRLDKANAGRIVKALCHLYKENKEIQSKFAVIEKDSIQRLDIIEASERRLAESEKDRSERLGVILNLEKRLEESEKDRSDRLLIIEDLEKRLEESEKDRSDRLLIIGDLEKRLKESERDRAERLRIIGECNIRLQTLNETCQKLNQELATREQQIGQLQAHMADLEKMLGLYWKEIEKATKK